MIKTTNIVRSTILNPKVLLCCAIGLMIFVVSSCLWNKNNDSDPLTMRLVGPESDTAGIQPSLKVFFSVPVTETDAAVDFFPSISGYYAFLNAAHDTLTVRITVPLSSETRYAMWLTADLTSADGGALKAGADSLIFHTLAVESEPNDNIPTADSLRSRIQGISSRTNDTDCFVLSSPSTPTALTLVSFGDPASFTAIDSAGRTFSGTRRYSPRDTIILSDSLAMPVRILVFPLLSSGGAYELGVVRE